MNEVSKRVYNIKSNLDKDKIKDLEIFIYCYKKENRIPSGDDILNSKETFQLEEKEYIKGKNSIDSIKEELLDKISWDLDSKLLIWSLREMDLLDYVFSKKELLEIRERIKKLLISKDYDTVALYGYSL